MLTEIKASKGCAPKTCSKNSVKWSKVEGPVLYPFSDLNMLLSFQKAAFLHLQQATDCVCVVEWTADHVSYHRKGFIALSLFTS